MTTPTQTTETDRVNGDRRTIYAYGQHSLEMLTLEDGSHTLRGTFSNRATTDVHLHTRYHGDDDSIVIITTHLLGGPVNLEELSAQVEEARIAREIFVGILRFTYDIPVTTA